MLPKLSCLSNYLCQSMNLAPHAIEEWDNESLSLCLSVCEVCTVWSSRKGNILTAVFLIKQKKNNCAPSNFKFLSFTGLR